jgi:POT family proton-dependent oligopeptide transporter
LSSTFFGHPRGLATLFFTEMWERFTYYGMRAVLVLFLVAAVSTGGFGIDDRTATAVYGLYTAGAYLAALPGGWIADRLIGAQRAVFVGGLAITLGNALLAMSTSPRGFYIGLVVIVIGVGLLKPNVSAIVADLYPEGGARLDSGFTVFYIGINVGGFLGPLLTGWAQVYFGLRAGFAAAALFMAIGVVQFYLTRRHLGTAGAYIAPAPGGGTDRTLHWLYLWVGIALSSVVLAAVSFGWIPVNAVNLAQAATYAIVGMAVLYFTKLSPKRFVGQMMGMWFLSLSLGNLLAGLIAGEFDVNNVAAMPGQYMHIVYFSVGLGAVLLILSRPVKKLMGDVQ